MPYLTCQRCGTRVYALPRSADMCPVCASPLVRSTVAEDREWTDRPAPGKQETEAA